MKKYTISIWGCDDWTEFEIDLTEDELLTVKKIETLSEITSTYACMPKLSVVLCEDTKP